MAAAMFESEQRGLPLLRRGKVRDVYQPSAEHLLIVACDRISAFDHVLPTPIPDKGKILTGSHGANGLRILPDERMTAYKRPPKTLPRSIGHHAEWVAACKGGPAAASNFDFAGPLTEIVLLGCAAIRSAEKLYWDAANMRFPNTPAADRFLRRQRRDGWNL